MVFFVEENEWRRAYRDATTRSKRRDHCMPTAGSPLQAAAAASCPTAACLFARVAKNLFAVGVESHAPKTHASHQLFGAL